MEHKRRVIIFDMDGVLIESEPLKARAHSEAIKILGGKGITDEVYKSNMGKSHSLVRSVFLKEANVSASDEEYDRLFLMKYRSIVENELVVNPCVPRFLQKLVDMDYHLAVVTSSSAEIMDHVLTLSGLNKYFRVKVCSDDVEHEKPAPDPYQLALKSLDANPFDSIVFEDSESGIKSAAAAGIDKIISVRHSYNKEHNFEKTNKTITSFCDSESLLNSIDYMLYL